MKLTRRDMVKLSLGTLAVSALRPLPELFAQTPLHMRAIPSSGERIPIVGIGTRDYDAKTPEIRAELKEVIRRFSELGGKAIDTSTHYTGGDSETILGELVAELGNRDRLFLATKVRGIGKQAAVAEIEQSFQRLHTEPIDLIAVHNIRDKSQIETLREMKQAGRIRYVGITTSFKEQYQESEEIMKAQPLDFVQIDYAINNRSAADRILPLAADRGIAIMVNMPFGYGNLFTVVRNRTLPDWAEEFDCKTWAQFLLKYVVSHPAVTCAIPGTGRVTHLLDNLQAAQGRLPDAAMRRRMEELTADFPAGGTEQIPDAIR
ncbi:MAG: aldo/keto reductase [Acidobacteria bacterium]|nr:aldo/keto reductase [Acidobacteriota bacterium]